MNSRYSSNQREAAIKDMVTTVMGLPAGDPRAPEMTTEEFLAATARGGALEPAHRTLLGGFLVESDLVKFARHVPSVDDSDRAFVAAERFVADTAARDRLPEEQVRAAG